MKNSHLDDLLLKEPEREEEYDEPSAPAIKRAKKDGLWVILPAPNELLIDIDTEEQYQTFLKALPRFERVELIQDWREEPSRSGLPARHIYVQLHKDIDALERIALQACLGSDLRRESLSLIRWLRDDPNPTLFFEEQS